MTNKQRIHIVHVHMRTKTLWAEACLPGHWLTDVGVSSGSSAREVNDITAQNTQLVSDGNQISFI